MLMVLSVFLLVKKYRQKRGSKTKIISVDNQKCARCLSCVLKCKHNVLEMVNNEKGMSVMVLQPEQCTACGHCIEVCRFSALELIERNSQNN